MNPGLTRPLKVGDKVWSKRFGYGQVIHVNQGDLVSYPYTVRFNASRTESFSVLGVYQITKPDVNVDLAGPLQKDETIKFNESTAIAAKVKQVENSENKKIEGTIIDIDGCKIFRSGGSMIILPQNDDLWLKQQFSF